MIQGVERRREENSSGGSVTTVNGVSQAFSPSGRVQSFAKEDIRPCSLPLFLFSCHCPRYPQLKGFCGSFQGKTCIVFLKQ